MRRSLTTLAAAATAYGAYRLWTSGARRYEFAGRNVVITGGSRGLGLVLARQFADQGARLAICARHADQLRRAAHELRGRGARVVSEPCDVTDEAAVESFFAAVTRELGPVDVLINNAGVIQVGPLDLMTPQDFEQAMAIHFWAPLRTMRQVLPEMRRRGQGRIVNISSFGGRVAAPHLVPYCASKFALVGLSRGFREELAAEGVYVTTVCPGLMRTGSHHHALFKGQHRAEYTWFSIGASLPVGAMSAETAARQIIRACRYGAAQATLSLPARLAEMADAVAPELVADVGGLVARLLPGPDGPESIGAAAAEGQDSRSAWSPSVMTLLGDRAAERNNELAP
ncbi:MAG TPA: SDR family oxidoreductase [Lacipirellulaceae bacterium]|nr:SDR family oxidoreductase [Lacipirellulaceae bacterium]